MCPRYVPALCARVMCPRYVTVPWLHQVRQCDIRAVPLSFAEDDHGD